MKKDIVFEKFTTTDLQWDYGFGKYGLGAYLWIWNTLILFIPDTQTIQSCQ